MDKILVGAADYVVVGDRNGIDAPTGCLQDMHTLQIPDVPDLWRRGGRGKNRKRMAVVNREKTPNKILTAYAPWRGGRNMRTLIVW